MFKKLISIILCIVLILSTTSIALAENRTINYVSLGASQTNGYGLDGYFEQEYFNWAGTTMQKTAFETNGFEASAWDVEQYMLHDAGTAAHCGAFGYKRIINDSFPMIIKRKFENQGYDVNFSQLAISGYRANDLLLFIDDEYTTDTFTDFFIFGEDAGGSGISKMTGLDTYAGYMSMKETYRDAIKNADLITYDLGSNNYGAFIAQMVRNNIQSYDFSKIMTQEQYEFFTRLRDVVRNQIKEMLNDYGIPESVLVDYENIIDMMAYTTFGYCYSLDRAVELIYDSNPDVTLVVMQVQNYLSELVIDVAGVDVPIGEMINILISYINAFAQSLSKYCSKYYYARITDNQRVEFRIDELREYNGNPEELCEAWIQMLDITDWNVHVKAQLTPKYEALQKTVGDAQYHDTLYAVYDSIMQLYKHIDANYKLNIEGLMSNDRQPFFDLIDTLIEDVANDVVSGNDYHDAIETAKDTLASFTKEQQGMCVAYLRTEYSLNFLSHPNENGHEQMSQAVLDALNTNNRGIKSVLAGLNNAYIDFSHSINCIKDYVEEFINTIENITIDDVLDMAFGETNTKIPFSNMAKDIKLVVKNVFSPSSSKVGNQSFSLKTIFR